MRFVMAGPVEMRVAHCVHDWASYTVTATPTMASIMDKCGIDIPVWARWWLATAETLPVPMLRC